MCAIIVLYDWDNCVVMGVGGKSFDQSQARDENISSPAAGPVSCVTECVMRWLCCDVWWCNEIVPTKLN